MPCAARHAGIGFSVGVGQEPRSLVLMLKARGEPIKIHSVCGPGWPLYASPTVSAQTKGATTNLRCVQMKICTDEQL